MSTTTPGGSEGSGGAAPANRPQSGASTASPASPRSATSAATAQDGERAETTAGSSVRRSLAERFAASAAGSRGATTTAADPDATRPSPRPASATGPAPEPGARQDAPVRPAAGPRRVRLSLSRVDPWSVMKLAFLMSIAIGIGIVVATAVVWFVLDSMHVFADIEELLVSIGSEDLVQLMAFVEFDRVISMATIIGVVDVLLLTALCTIGAFVYNLVAALVGGLHLTLTDD